MNLLDPRNPGQLESFPVTQDFTERLSKHFKRKIVGLFDNVDRVYFPTRFVLLNPAYFSSRSQLLLLSDVNVVPRRDNTTEVSAVGTADDREGKCGTLTLEIAQQIFSAIGPST